MGLKGEAAIVGYVEWKPERRRARPPEFTIEQWAHLTKGALDDAGVSVESGQRHRDLRDPGIGDVRAGDGVGVPRDPVDFAEYVDLGGATCAGMIWRAAAAVELGLADVVVCAAPSSPVPRPPTNRPPDSRRMFGASSNAYGSPQAEFEIPYGNLAQNAPYAQIAQRYAYEFGYDPRALAKIAVDQRTNACANPQAVFYGQPITVDDVLNSPMIADPLHLLEIVMPVTGGAAVVVANADVARSSHHRPVWVKGFGERVAFKTPTYAEDLLWAPLAPAARTAFAMAGSLPTTWTWRPSTTATPSPSSCSSRRQVSATRARASSSSIPTT